MDLTTKDIVLLHTALDGFIKVGNVELCKDKAQRMRNKQSAIRCKFKLENQEQGFSRDECRVAHIALLLLFDEISSIPNSDPETPDVLKRLKILINALDPT